MHRTLVIEIVPIGQLRPDPDNPRAHPPAQLRKLAKSIARFGFTNPILIDEDGQIIAGHGRWEAARLVGLREVPVIRLVGLSADERRALMLADNRIALESTWNPERLAKVLGALVQVEFALDETGFEIPEIDGALGLYADGAVDEADRVDEPDRKRPVVSRVGDLFRLGEHRLLCADALLETSYAVLLGGERAGMAFTDPPFNHPTVGHISRRKGARHGNFVQAGGEMSDIEYEALLATALTHLGQFTAPGAIIDVCIDWRRFAALVNALPGPLTLFNTAVWAKSNAGQGSLYRSQHEFVAIIKNGDAAHVNNVQLGRHGRNRGNLWTHPGANGFRRGRVADLEAHPTVKPVQLVADAILDTSRPADWILDPFAGSGTILLACQRTKRRAAAMELDPLYVDGALRRFEARTGIVPVHEATGLTFKALAAERAREENDR